ncbi:MAG TPA: hypothetical protein VER11_18965, partial [Polyangiaceae bacterium]|nr:hypothetical protein [Polyangiaceae bacterium]
AAPPPSEVLALLSPRFGTDASAQHPPIQRNQPAALVEIAQARTRFLVSTGRSCTLLISADAAYDHGF